MCVHVSFKLNMCNIYRINQNNTPLYIRTNACTFEIIPVGWSLPNLPEDTTVDFGPLRFNFGWLNLQETIGNWIWHDILT